MIVPWVLKVDDPLNIFSVFLEVDTYGWYDNDDVGEWWSYRIETQEYTGPLSSSRKSDLNIDVEYDASRTTDHNDETNRPSFDSK